MPLRIVALFLIASLSAAQTPTALPPPASTPSGTITVPPATLIALKLISSIKSRSTKPGDPVRAVVAFPLVVGTQIAIPAGTYVEGVVDKVYAHPSGGSPATVQLRFTRLLFANGYSVPVTANNTQASNISPVVFSPSTYLLADARDGAPYLGEGFTGASQNPPPPQLPPSNGPSPAALVGIGVGATVGVVVLSLVIGHHRAANADYVLFDAGWQFQMALQEPLALDAAQVSAAVALSH